MSEIESSKSPPAARIIREPETLAMVGVSPVTLWRWEKAGKFPKRLKIGPRAMGWKLSDIENWIEQKNEAAHAN
jgi:prophage regulatory protein